jgi:hypothetical protein
MTKDSLDLGLIAVFKSHGQIEDPIKLARLARDYGFRGARLETDNADLQQRFAQACQTFSLTLSSIPGQALPADIVSSALAARVKSANASFEINLTPAGKIAEDDLTKLAALNQWLHYYGHAFYEGRPSQIETPAPNLILQNAHAPYQIYLFAKKLSQGKLSITNLPASIKKVESIAQRTELTFSQAGASAEIAIDQASDAIWPGLRIMLHRPEDDLGKTKY